CCERWHRPALTRSLSCTRRLHFRNLAAHRKEFPSRNAPLHSLALFAALHGIPIQPRRTSAWLQTPAQCSCGLQHLRSSPQCALSFGDGLLLVTHSIEGVSQLCMCFGKLGVFT